MRALKRLAFPVFLASSVLICRRVALVSRWSANNLAVHQNVLVPKKETAGEKLRVLPRPIQLLQQYQQWHSEESMRRHPQDRKYAVVFYGCPQEAGNRLHHWSTGASLVPSGWVKRFAAFAPS